MLGSISLERDRGDCGPGRDRRTVVRAGRGGRAARRHTAALVEFTPDGKLKKPDGYRNGCTSARR